MNESAEPQPSIPSIPKTSEDKPQPIETSAEIKAWFNGEEFRRFQRREIDPNEWYAFEEGYKERARKDPEFALEYARRVTKNEEEIAQLEQAVLEQRRKKEQVVLEKQQEERESKLPKNLLTHLDDTIRAIACIEGESWLNGQREEDGKNVFTALQVIADARKQKTASKYPLFDMYGMSVNRYWVFSDGTVKFSQHHGTRKDIERARRLGFDVT